MAEKPRKMPKIRDQEREKSQPKISTFQPGDPNMKVGNMQFNPEKQLWENMDETEERNVMSGFINEFDANFDTVVVKEAPMKYTHIRHVANLDDFKKALEEATRRGIMAIVSCFRAMPSDFLEATKNGDNAFMFINVDPNDDRLLRALGLKLYQPILLYFQGARQPIPACRIDSYHQSDFQGFLKEVLDWRADIGPDILPLHRRLSVGTQTEDITMDEKAENQDSSSSVMYAVGVAAIGSFALSLFLFRKFMK